MKLIDYNRNNAYEYARKWAYDRNPKYYNYDKIGGDCTNFISQCIFSGCGVMNYAKENGWYYMNANNKSPSWTSVQFLHNFICSNKGVGPYGKECGQNEVNIGDIVQLSFDGSTYEHSLIVVKITDRYSLDNIFIASHTFDSFERKISSYSFHKARFVHIEGARAW